VRALAAVAVALVASCILWNSLQAVRQGWVAEGDAAIIAVRTHDVFTAHPPLLGNPSTASDAANADAYHPGPLEFALLAIPLRVFGSSTDGLVWGSAAIAVATVGALAWFAHRRGGPAFVLWTMLVTAVLVWGLGNEIPHDPYNPHVVLLPMFLLLVLVWSLALGDAAALVGAVAVGSFVTQSHVYDGLFVAGVAVAALVAVTLYIRRTAREERRRFARFAFASAIVGVVLWSPPIVYELTHHPGNLRALWDAARSSGTRGEGPVFAWHRLVDTMAPPWRWLDGQPTLAALHSKPGILRTILAVAVLAALVAIGVRARRRGRRSVTTLVGTALAGLGVSAAMAARLPQGLASLSPYNHRHWWVTGAFAFLAIGWGAIDIGKSHVAPRAGRRTALAALGAVAVAVLVVAASAGVTIHEDRGSAGFGAIRALVPPVIAALGDHREVLVIGRGGQAFTSIEPGLVAALLQRGYDPRVRPFEGNVFGTRHVGDPSLPTQLFVVSGDGADVPPAPGARLVGRYDARVDAEDGFVNAGVGHADLIAVYLVTAG
jgi:hypothetical protein